VLEGLGRAAVVAATVPLPERLEAGRPAMAVRSSVADEDVAVALRAPEIMIAGTLVTALADIRLLGRREVVATEALCAERHCASKAQEIRMLGIEENIMMKIGL
jgi:hypothetical protein